MCRGKDLSKGQDLPILSSFKVSSSGFRIFCGRKPKVIRDASGYGKVNGLDSLLDDIDKILGRTTISPILMLLVIIIIGVAGTVPMVIYNNMNQMWLVWCLPYLAIGQPYLWTMYGMRSRKMEATLDEWNRSQGVSQGVQVHLGTDDQVHHRQFYSSLLWCPCNNTPNVHVCSMGAPA